MRPTTRPPERTSPVARCPHRRRSGDRGYGVVVVACSTGGPEALTHVLPHWNLHVPVIVVQHMPPDFTALLAERLDRLCPMTVTEARDGERVEPGRILIAPGGRHLRLGAVSGHAQVQLTDDPLVNSLRPAADVTFADAAELWGAEVLAVVLTGMGRDGVRGSGAVAAAGGMVLVQDEPSSRVWGMPGEVVRAGLATGVLPLERFATTVPTLCQTRRELTIPEQARPDRSPVGPHF